MGKSLTDIHNEGQNDRASGNDYDPPHGLVEDLFTWSPDSVRTLTEENAAYGGGWHNADKQDPK